MEWIDATSYRQGERDKTTPRAWSIVSGSVRIWVGNDHRDDPGQWVMHCNYPSISTKRLGLDSTAHETLAQQTAIAIARAAFAKVVADMDALPKSEIGSASL